MSDELEQHIFCSSLITHTSSLLCLIYVWQGLFGSRPRWRMIEQYRHFLQLIEFRAGPNQNLMRLCCVARVYLHNLTDSQTRRINPALATLQYVIPQFNFPTPA